MNRDAWRERRSKTTNWMMEGRGRRRLGMGGRPIEREERDRKTKVWSGISWYRVGMR